MNRFSKGQNVKLIFTGMDGLKKELICLVKNIDKELLYLDPPPDIINYTTCLEEGKEISVNIFTPLGVTIFDSIVLNSPTESDFIIEYIETHEHIQRREYIREIFETKMVIERANGNNLIAKTLDIGGGGTRFLCEGMFKHNEVVTATLYLASSQPAIKFEGTIVKQEHFAFNQHVIIFTQINERDRDKIIKLCFEIQRNAQLTSKANENYL